PTKGPPSPCGGHARRRAPAGQPVWAEPPICLLALAHLRAATFFPQVSPTPWHSPSFPPSGLAQMDTSRHEEGREVRARRRHGQDGAATGKSIPERAKAMISLADLARPSGFRDDLEREARVDGLIPRSFA